MDVKEYARAKYEIADVLRSASLVARAKQPENLYPFEDLFARLAEDRFNLVVVGQFSRGKTSLMNAILNTDRLPVGVVPLTSVITAVQYGTRERAIVEYEERRLPCEIPLDALPDFVTQRNNPGNEKGVKFARIELPAELLRRGFYLVDTPGLGSAIVENSRTTESFLPQADAFIVVTSFDSPLSHDEIGLLNDLGANARRTFLVINKMDIVDSQEQCEVEDHVLAQLRALPNAPSLELFSLSAREAIAASHAHDESRYTGSGLPAFLERLTRFLVEEKSAEFLRGIFERAEEQLARFDGCAGHRTQMANLRNGLKDLRSDPPAAEQLAKQAVPRFSSCAVCMPIERKLREFLQQFQYRIMIDEEAQCLLHSDLGLCPFHTWQYAALASPHGTCIAFPGVFDVLINNTAKLRSNGAGSLEALNQFVAKITCEICRVHNEAENVAVSEIARFVLRELTDDKSRIADICLGHLKLVVAAVGEPAGGRLLSATAESWDRIADDMRRYALKRDGSRRAFTTQDELDADLRGLRALAGHSALSFVQSSAR